MATLPRLVGTAEIAQLLAVHRSRAAQLVNTKGFPDPVAKIGRSHGWRYDDVIAWAEAGGREVHELEDPPAEQHG